MQSKLAVNYIRNIIDLSPLILAQICTLMTYNEDAKYFFNKLGVNVDSIGSLAGFILINKVSKNRILNCQDNTSIGKHLTYDDDDNKSDVWDHFEEDVQEFKIIYENKWPTGYYLKGEMHQFDTQQEEKIKQFLNLFETSDLFRVDLTMCYIQTLENDICVSMENQLNVSVNDIIDNSLDVLRAENIMNHDCYNYTDIIFNCCKIYNVPKDVCKIIVEFQTHSLRLNDENIKTKMAEYKKQMGKHGLLNTIKNMVWSLRDYCEQIRRNYV